jgi:hypothetical protein
LTAPDTRESRACAKCGVTDTHAHHVQYVAFNHPVTGEGLDLSVTKHVQCCAEDGCEICSVDVELLPDTAVGDAFDQALQNRPSEHLQVLFERVAVESPQFNIPTTEEA